MKIIQINAIYKYGSTGRTTMEMHEYCLLQGVESHVFCSNISDEDHNIYRIGTAIDHKLHGLWSHIWQPGMFLVFRHAKGARYDGKDSARCCYSQKSP